MSRVTKMHSESPSTCTKAKKYPQGRYFLLDKCFLGKYIVAENSEILYVKKECIYDEKLPRELVEVFN